MKINQPIFIITGEQGAGKTSFLKEVIDLLKKKNIRVGGFVADGFWKNDQRHRFILVNQITGEQLTFCQRDKVDGWEKIRHFYVNPLGQEFGEKALLPRHNENIDIVAVDEVGPFELEGKGWSKSLEIHLQERNLPMIWVARKSMITKLINKWDLVDYQIFPFNKTDVLFLTNSIYKFIKHSE